FIQLFKAGLLYKKNAPINFCPKCKTGLAEEEVLPNGTHERCGNVVEKRELPQWLFRITAYGDRLLHDLKQLKWPTGILEMQKNWIGRKEGIDINYQVISADESTKILSRLNSSPSLVKQKVAQNFVSSSFQVIDTITCFTTRPDTNFGATFIVIAPEHGFVNAIIDRKLTVPAGKLKEIKDYVEAAKRKSEMEREAEGRKKTGVFTGFHAVNNLNGRLLPVWISDFVLMGFGTGAVVGVPGHDLRDFEFAQTFGIPVVRVVVGKDGDRGAITQVAQVQEDEGTMINSEFLNGLDIHAATNKIMDHLEEKGWGKRVISYHLHDWIFSRQHYWGEPIPMVFCQACADKKINYWSDKKAKKRLVGVASKSKDGLDGWFPLPDDQLPLKLPYVKSYEPTATGASPLVQIGDFVATTCPRCGGPASRETDTMPNWAGSCWYFLAFALENQDIRRRVFSSASPQRGPKRLTQKQASSLPFLETWRSQLDRVGSCWLPVDWYIGGAEHAVLHLLYARFWVKAFQELGLLDFGEPFIRLRNVGMVLAEDHRKMSKSLGNVINPDDVVKEYGADALRLYEMFMAPFNLEIAWSTRALQGVYRFLQRVWQLYQPYRQTSRSSLPTNFELINKLSWTIDKASQGMEKMKFNTVIAAMMEFLNQWETTGQSETGEIALSPDRAKQFLQVLAPFAPFITEEIWRSIFGEKHSIHLSRWPTAAAIKIGDVDLVIPVQINGKLRATVAVKKSQASEANVVKRALGITKIKQTIGNHRYKVIYVKDKIINLVVENQ
ncbi:class I tRNA ligase family protein, partial [Patescibacteria group bacterium]|nr:class I tRNA ligase family protein [Patescibacteria group bacterium]